MCLSGSQRNEELYRNPPPLSGINRFCKPVLRYGYTIKYTPTTDVITIKDRLLLDKITADNTHSLHELLPPKMIKKHFPVFFPKTIFSSNLRLVRYTDKCMESSKHD